VVSRVARFQWLDIEWRVEGVLERVDGVASMQERVPHTGFCPMAMILRKLGASPGAAFR
jgi:hypothetical protein